MTRHFMAGSSRNMHSWRGLIWRQAMANASQVDWCRDAGLRNRWVTTCGCKGYWTLASIRLETSLTAAQTQRYTSSSPLKTDHIHGNHNGLGFDQESDSDLEDDDSSSSSYGSSSSSSLSSSSSYSSTSDDKDNTASQKNQNAFAADRTFLLLSGGQRGQNESGTELTSGRPSTHADSKQLRTSFM